MKIFCLTFIVYLLALSWQPCNDLSAKISNGNSNSVAETNLSNEPEMPNEPDDCSPFCICSCCQISTVYANLNFTVTIASVVSFEKTSDISYQNSYSFQNLDLIWQPPKI